MPSQEKTDALRAKLAGAASDKSPVEMLMASARAAESKAEAKEYRDREPGKRVPTAGSQEQDDDSSHDDDTTEEETQRIDPDGDAEGDDQPEGDASDDADDEQAQDEEQDFQELDYDDEDTIEVTVDGEVKEVSLRDLKAAYSGEGAIDKRLKEATEERKAAKAERAQAVQEIEEHRTNLLQTISTMSEALFMPLVEKPPSALRASNMQQYLMQQDAFEEDQQRIQGLRGKMAQLFISQQEEQAEHRRVYRLAQQAELLEKLPELRDPQKAPKVQADIMKAAKHYGFTEKDVAEVDNHGLFLMARDAARWLNMQEMKKNSGVPTGGETLKRKRHLRPGGAVASTKLLARKSDAENRKLTSLAAKTGKPDDIANMLAAKVRPISKRK